MTGTAVTGSVSALILGLTLLAVSCDNKPKGPSKQEMDEVRAAVARATALIGHKEAAWRNTMGAAIRETAPVLGDKCPVQVDYSVEHFQADAWQKVGIQQWNDEERPAHAQVAAWAVRMVEEYIDENPRLAQSFAERLQPYMAEEYWDYDLTLLQRELKVPEQGDDGTYVPGTLEVRALLYPYKGDKVICEALYQVTNDKSIELSFTYYGTDKEIKEIEERQRKTKPNSRVLAAAVVIDLSRTAFYAANKHLRVVAGR